jgi:YHS domain-containing protein
MFAGGAPTLPEPAGLPALPAVQPAELPSFEQEPALLGPVVEADPAEPLPVASDAAFELPQITPAACGGASPTPDSAHQASHESHADKFAQIASRSGTGFKGFCPVVLRDERDLLDSSEEFSATFESQTYHVSSAEAQAKFEAGPEKYAPAHAGQDVVCTADGKNAPGSIDHAVWFRNRLYLFSTHETLRKFVTEPARFIRDE